MKLTPKAGALVTLVVAGGAYVYLSAKGQKPPPGLDQVIVAAAGMLVVDKGLSGASGSN